MELVAKHKILKEYTTLVLAQQPLCIEYPPLDIAFELNLRMIKLLPKFYGHQGEHTNKHLKEFHIVYSSMKPAGVSEDQLKLWKFPFSLVDLAKEWLYYFPFEMVNI
ncbi:hypothetical protein PanWU01x14_326490 [Parasponia andersonii]|uniref:Retrotransposon gag protein n=1 Tax=Parasponia andersonii TaxID=3476 RepID=A0A2P5AJF8_PARAD|nr:hypothetical protein PanWU01x14_326490 [Parasponia andersonii]